MKRRTIIFILGLILLLILSITCISKDTKSEGTSVQNISIIIRGKVNEKWENLKQGAEQAGTDMNANISFVSLSAENNTLEQIKLLKREARGDANAILIAPTDDFAMSSEINKIKKNIPITLIESGIHDVGLFGYISCNNTEMGKDLAVEVVRHGNTRKNVVVLDGGIQCSSVQERKRAFVEAMSDNKNKIIEWTKPDFTWEAILESLYCEDIDVLVALDDSVLENAAKAVSKYRENGKRKIEVYGVGNSRDIMYYLENDYIVSTIVQDDFSIGYLGVKNVINTKKGYRMDVNNEVAYAVIDHEHMYSEQNQRLIFPFIR